jgi:hypothetical protein
MSLSCPFGHFGEKPRFDEETVGVVTERHRQVMNGMRDPPLDTQLITDPPGRAGGGASAPAECTAL